MLEIKYHISWQTSYKRISIQETDGKVDVDAPLIIYMKMPKGDNSWWCLEEISCRIGQLSGAQIIFSKSDICVLKCSMKWSIGVRWVKEIEVIVNCNKLWTSFCWAKWWKLCFTWRTKGRAFNILFNWNKQLFFIDM